MKRIICIVFTLAIMLGLFSVLNISVSATASGVDNSRAAYIDIDIYRAQCFAGIAYDPDAQVVEDCSKIYNYYINEGIYSPTKSFLDAVYADDELMAEFALWQLESLGVDSSSIVDTPIQKKDYYESLITSIIAHEYAEDSPKTQDLAIQATGYSATIVDSLCNITDSVDTLELVDKLDVNSPDTMMVLEQMFNEHPELGGFDVIDIILSASNTIMDAIEKIAAYSTMHSLDQETKDWLESMYNACDKNTDAALKTALFNLMNASFSFTHAVLVDIKDTSFRLANWGIGATVNVGLSMLAATNPLTTAIMAGLKLGKTICDICFATSDICEQLFLLDCMYDIQSLARTVAEDAKTSFVNSQTNANAKAFTYAVHYYFESIINTDIDCMISFLDLLYNGGLLKGALTWVYGVTDDYQEAVDSLESLREVRQNNYNLMIKLYKAALAINYKDTYDYHYTVDNTVPISSISFREMWLLPMEVGDFSNIYVQYEPSNTTQKAYTVTSDNPAVVEVHDNIITAVAEGAANITISSIENPQISYTKKITVNAESEETKPEDSSARFTYTVKDGQVTIMGMVEGYEPNNLTIPSYLGGYPVVGIGNFAFNDCQNLKRVTIPNSVTTIGSWAFKDCSSLTSITIPSNVTTIWGDTFYGCSSLSSVTIPNGITSIGSGAFRNCSMLTSITIPDSVTAIGADAFRSCSSLTSITIPGNLISIGEYAFRGCSNLTDIYITDLTAWLNVSPDDWLSHPITSNALSKRIYLNGEILTDVVIPEGVTTIGDYAFYSCGSLTSITIPDSVTSIGYSAFRFCDSVTCITIQDAATSIGTYAFSNCDSLSSITIPDSVTKIGSFAFENCGNLTSVTIQGGVTTIGDFAFNRCGNLSNVIIRGGVSRIGNGAFRYCSLTNLILPAGVTSIGDEAFYYCDGLTSITIPSSVTSIGEDAFYGCDSLTKIYITDLAAWLSISHNGMFSLPIAFYSGKRLYLNGELLTDVVIPEGITTVGDYAFYRCDSIKSITIPSSVTSIGESAFAMCDNLTDIYITDLSAWLNISYNGSGSIPTYANDLEKRLYLDEMPLIDVIIPDSITAIGDYTFRNCNSLTSVKISNGVTAIGVSAFANCTGLKQIELPDSITSIGDSAFSGCSKLTDISLPDSITAIGKRIFDSCTSLKQVEIPNGVISIGDYAFMDCSSLTSIIVPDSITTIGYGAFEYCLGLNKVFFKGNAPIFEQQAFYCTRATAYYPADNTTWNEETKQDYGGRITWVAYQPVSITKQPVNTSAYPGSTAKITVSATGDGLTYQWYFKNPGSTKFSLTTSFKGNSYSVAMDESRNGRQVYCVITDQYGNSVTTNTVTLSMQTKLAITRQPASVKVAEGATAKVTVSATGDGLTYKWYYKNPGASKFSLTTSFTGNSYAIAMNDSRNGRQVYCVITDKYGNSVTTDTVTLSMRTKLAITKQPSSVVVKNGEKATVKVTAVGDGLTYRWYYKNKGDTAYTYTASFTGNTYSITMTDARAGRRVLCRVYDQYGNVVKSESVVLSQAVRITKQPTGVVVKNGEKATVKVTAVGDGLTYRWYYKNKGDKDYTYTAAFTGNTYSITMTDARAGRWVLCRVYDQYGNVVASKSVALSQAVRITKQPVSVTVAEGKTAKVTVTALGDGLTYKWYFRNAGSSKFSLTTSFTGNTYSLTMSDARSGRQVYCVVTDKYGNTVKTSTATLRMK